LRPGPLRGLPVQLSAVRPAFKIKTGIFPGGGKEHPSRGGAGCVVTILTQIISQPTNGRANNVLGGRARMMGRTGVLGSSLFFALLFDSVQAFAATPPAGQMVTLAWNPSLDTNVVGYNIYYGGASGDYTNKINAGNATNISISGLVAGSAYYFAASAYDKFGQESVYSPEISYTVPEPLPTVQISSAPAGQFILTLSGPNGDTYNILASQDLMAWTVIGAATVGSSGSVAFTDTNAAYFRRRFYRTQETP
jgi:hypothetical protein